jgi:hypothetical protein
MERCRAPVNQHKHACLLSLTTFTARVVGLKIVMLSLLCRSTTNYSPCPLLSVAEQMGQSQKRILVLIDLHGPVDLLLRAVLACRTVSNHGVFPEQV